MSANTSSLALQGSLFGVDAPAVDEEFSTLQRLELDGDTWLDHAADWLRAMISSSTSCCALPWRQRTVTMYERRLPERASRGGGAPMAAIRAVADPRHDAPGPGQRYDKVFDSIGFNCYRHGEDSVAWHGDRHRHTVVNPIVAIVSVGSPSVPPRPRGGHARTFDLGHGDLFVMGGVPAPVGAQRAEGASCSAAHLHLLPPRGQRRPQGEPSVISTAGGGESAAGRVAQRVWHLDSTRTSASGTTPARRSSTSRSSAVSCR